MNNSLTPYLFFVDVDLVPNPGVYDILKRNIAKYLFKYKELVGSQSVTPSIKFCVRDRTLN